MPVAKPKKDTDYSWGNIITATVRVLFLAYLLPTVVSNISVRSGLIKRPMDAEGRNVYRADFAVILIASLLVVVQFEYWWQLRNE